MNKEASLAEMYEDPVRRKEAIFEKRTYNRSELKELFNQQKKILGNKRKHNGLEVEIPHIPADKRFIFYNLSNKKRPTNQQLADKKAATLKRYEKIKKNNPGLYNRTRMYNNENYNENDVRATQAWGPAMHVTNARKRRTKRRTLVSGKPNHK